VGGNASQFSVTAILLFAALMVGLSLFVAAAALYAPWALNEPTLVFQLNSDISMQLVFFFRLSRLVSNQKPLVFCVKISLPDFITCPNATVYRSNQP